MHSMLAGAILAAGLAVAGPASATVVYDLSGITFAGGGTLTGSFTLSDDLKHIVSADIVASASNYYTGFTYLYPTDALSQSLPTQYFQLTSGNDTLRLSFDVRSSTPFTLAYANSYEDERGWIRSLASGSLVRAAVPEPASIVMLGVGLLGVAGLRRRMRTSPLPSSSPSPLLG